MDIEIYKNLTIIDYRRSKKVKKEKTMKISDLIEEVIKELLENEDGVAQFKRNELALRLNCVPSQINYVINNRFSNEHGYIVESRRGGGGFVTIKRIKMGKSGYFMHIIASIGSSISQASAFFL